MTAMDKQAASERDEQRGRLGFGTGLKAPLRGVGFIARRADLWLLAAVPALVALAIAATLGTASVMWLPRLAAWLIGPTTTWYGEVGAAAASFALAALGVLLSIALALTFAQPLSGPALDRLALAMEQSIGAPTQPIVPFWRQAARSAGGALLGLAVGLPILAVLTVISFIVPLAAWVTFPLQLVVSGMMVTWDLMDYPFTIRGWTLTRRLAWMRANLPAALGFGLALGIVLLIPCVHVLLLPAGTVGATWLYHQSPKPPA